MADGELANRRFTSGRQAGRGYRHPLLNQDDTTSPPVVQDALPPWEQHKAPPKWTMGCMPESALGSRGSRIATRVSLFENFDVDKHQKNVASHAEDPEFLKALQMAAQASQVLHSANPSAIETLAGRVPLELDATPVPVDATTGGDAPSSPSRPPKRLVGMPAPPPPMRRESSSPRPPHSPAAAPASPTARPLPVGMPAAPCAAPGLGATRVPDMHGGVYAASPRSPTSSACSSPPSAVPSWARASSALDRARAAQALALEQERELEKQREREREERWEKWREERSRSDRVSRAEASEVAKDWLSKTCALAEEADDWPPTPERSAAAGSSDVGARARPWTLPRISRAGFGRNATSAGGGPRELPRVRRVTTQRRSWSRRDGANNPDLVADAPQGAALNGSSPKGVNEPLPLPVPPPPPPRRSRPRPPLPLPMSPEPVLLRDGQAVQPPSKAASTPVIDDLLLPLPGLPPPPPPRKKRQQTQIWL